MALGTNLEIKSEDEREDQFLSENNSDDLKDESHHEEIEGEEAVERSQYCVFKAGAEEYAIPIDAVKEVVKYAEPAPIPQMPNYILGMANVRGNIYGVMDLECYFKGVVMGSDRKYLLVLDHETYKMAISIEEVPNSLMVAEDQLEQLNASSFKSVIGQKFLQGIIKVEKRMIILLNVLDMIASEDFTSIKD